MTLPTEDAQSRRIVRYEFMKRALIVFTAIVSTVILGSTLFLAAQAAQTTRAIRDTQKNNHVLLDTINDCTQTSGDCYKRNQQQTAAAVGDINRVIILAAACASALPSGLSVVDRQNSIQACVISGLSHKR